MIIHYNDNTQRIFTALCFNSNKNKTSGSARKIIFVPAGLHDTVHRDGQCIKMNNKKPIDTITLKHHGI